MVEETLQYMHAFFAPVVALFLCLLHPLNVAVGFLMAGTMWIHTPLKPRCATLCV